jgi:DNA-binding XRE family transcriptional regulator
MVNPKPKVHSVERKAFTSDSRTGSRQPILKLPRAMPDGKTTKLHPFTYLLRQRDEETTKSDLARHLGVRPQSLYKWERKCEADRNFPLPVLRASQLAAYFGVPPTLFRPDFPWSAAK